MNKIKIKIPSINFESINIIEKAKNDPCSYQHNLVR